MASGKLEAIWLKRMKSGPMDAYSFTDLVANRGIAGNTNQGGKRQVTIIEKELWDELKTTLSEKIEPKMRRANLMVSGVQLAHSRGKILRIGDCR
ncbi:MAG: sulfurase, partial [Calditrichaeota bacterium]|nr:sulfurase [Calditrichota bacterium]